MQKLKRADFYLRCFQISNQVQKEQDGFFLCKPRSQDHIFSRCAGFHWHWVALISHEASILLLPSSPIVHYDDEKALRSRSAARPGEVAPLVTLSSRWGRASLTLGWFWKWRRTFSWIKLHIQTFCWALRRPWNSPLASIVSRYDSILAQTSGMPSLVYEEARTTWVQDACVNLKQLVGSLDSLYGLDLSSM